MDVKLRVLAGKHAGKEIALVRPKFLIGRAEDCHLRAGSDLISRHHCVISVSDGTLTIKDFGSRNGTLVNEERIEAERTLQAGDRLKVGPLEFEIVVKQPAKKQAVSVKTLKAAAEDDDADGNVEDSISNWLGEPDVGETRALADTRSFKAGDTNYHKVEKPAEIEEPAPPAGKKEPGKLPPLPQQPKAKDSREAAANILREMAKRR